MKILPTLAGMLALCAWTLHAQMDTTKPPADFIDVDTQPVVIATSMPDYPELAKKAGMEGTVWTKIWVDTKGMPRDVIVLKSDQQVFNGSAIEAARKFRFRPAMMKGKPVDVWVSVPFRFKLAEKSAPSSSAGESAREPFPPPIMDFVREVLQGPVPDTGRTSALLASGAMAVASGYLKPLAQAIKEQGEGKQSIEQRGRKVVFFTYGMAEGGKSGYIVARTEKSGKTASPHYHTIILNQDAEGRWKVNLWQGWMGGR